MARASWSLSAQGDQDLTRARGHEEGEVVSSFGCTPRHPKCLGSVSPVPVLSAEDDRSTDGKRAPGPRSRSCALTKQQWCPRQFVRRVARRASVEVRPCLRAERRAVQRTESSAISFRWAPFMRESRASCLQPRSRLSVRPPASDPPPCPFLGDSLMSWFMRSTRRRHSSS